VSAIHGAGAGELLDKIYDVVETKFPVGEQPSEGTCVPLLVSQTEG
jgi:hypothetical protein